MEIFILIIILLVVAGLIVFVVVSRKSVKNKKQINGYDRKTERSNTATAKSYFFQNGDSSVCAKYIADENKKVVLASSNSSDYTIIPFSKISGYQIIIDDRISGSVKRTHTGKNLFDGAGGVVGMVSAQKTIKGYKLALLGNDETPCYAFNLVEKEIRTDSIDLVNVLNFSMQVESSIKSIIATERNHINANS